LNRATDEATSVAKVFISYRRDDAAGYAGWAFDMLAASAGPGEVFLDQQALTLGDDWRRVIERKLGECAYFIAIIGPRWGGDGSESSRLHDADDMVRFEIASALERAALDELKFVILLVDGAPLPANASLPEDLRALTRYQAAAVDLASFRDVMARLQSLVRQEDADEAAPGGCAQSLAPLTDRSETEAAYAAFRARMRLAAREMHIHIAHPRGAYDASVFYHPHDNIWCHLRRGAPGEGRDYMPFGWGRPFLDRANSMVVQFNPAHSGDNPRLGGVWLKDAAGNLFIGHTGRVGGGTPGVGKRQFIDFHEDGDWRSFQRTAGRDRAIVFGPITPDMPLTALAQFVGKVKDFKDRLALPGPPQPLTTQQSAGP